MSTISAEHLQALRSAIVDKPPYCSGICPVAQDNFLLYYTTNGNDARRIDFAKATDEELRHLAEACAPATFGRNSEDVLDDSYRKAGKLDKTAFATNYFPLDHAALINALRSELLHGHDERKPIRLELYKLNIYGPGSFFKPHKDTPRAENMFGSLVIVYPTPHEGGILVIRHGAKEWEFDSGTLLRSSNEPSLAYAAFYGDVEHEVTPVQSGYRVTLTYNLYFADADSTVNDSSVARSISGHIYEQEFREVFRKLLDDPTFLPAGGTLGFGLRYQYPVEKGRQKEYPVPARSVVRAQECLKGSDAVVMKVAKEFSLDASVKALYYEGRKQLAMTDNFVPTNYGSDYGGNEDVVENIARWAGVFVHDVNAKKRRTKLTEEVHWVTGIDKVNQFSDPYLAYGNEPDLGFVYGNMCLIVRIGPLGARKDSVNPRKKKTQRTEGEGVLT